MASNRNSDQVLETGYLLTDPEAWFDARLSLKAEFDADGFLMEPEIWNEALAEEIALADGLGHLDAEQLAVLRLMRCEFDRVYAVPALSHICHLAGCEADCLTRLFRNPRQAWRLAGLPNPGEEAKSYL